MKTRRWVFFILLNVLVSALTTLAVLSFTGELQQTVVVTATPDVAVAIPIPTAEPAGQATEPVLSPTAPTSLEYTVQAGDTLGGIAVAFEIPLDNLLLANELVEDSIIRPGDVLIIPLEEEVPTPVAVTPSRQESTPAEPMTPTPFPTETPTPAGPVQVRIQELVAPGDLEQEGVVIVNRGRTVNLENWTLGAEDGDEVYVFPRLTLAQEVPVTVYTASGSDSPQGLHWGLEVAQWDESGTAIELRDAEGDLIATFTVP
jgi:LysM repeat protein